MTEPAAPTESRRDRRRLALGLVALAATATGLTAAVTGALFTDTQSIGGNSFTTGSVDLSATPTSSAVTLSNMAPGDVVTGPVTVNNAGSLAHRYSLLSTTDVTDADFLAAQLEMSIKTGVTSCTTADFAADGTALYTTGVLGSTTGTKVLGDAATGSQAGDRTLAAGASEVLCVQVSLPAGTDNDYQSTETTAVLRFDAEQTVNNP